MNELPLPFVNDLKHLGNVLQSDNSMTIDCNKKRAIFIFIYFDVPLEHEWKEELLSTRMNNLYVEGFDDYVITEMINMLCSE